MKVIVEFDKCRFQCFGDEILINESFTEYHEINFSEYR